MAYADLEFYTNTFYGDTLTEDDADKWLSLASDELDAITFGRLITAFPTVETHAIKVKKSVCAVADALFQIDVQRKAASAQKTEDGSYRGAIASISSGRESISFSSGNSAASASVYAAAAADTVKQSRLIQDIAVKYLANVPDKSGVNLLYAGV